MKDLLDPTALNGDVGYSDYALTEGAVSAVIRDNETPGVVPYPTDASFDCTPLQNNGYEEDCDWETDSDFRWLIESTGTYLDGERIVEAVVRIHLGGFDYANPTSIAIFAEDDLALSGNPFIWGPNANVHTNSNMTISGNPEIWGSISATGTIDVSGVPVDQFGNLIELDSGAARLETPYVFPPAYKPVATFYLTADCDVYDGWPIADHTLLADDVKTNPDWMGSWNCDYNDFWKLDGDFPPEGFYYVEANVFLSSAPGLGIVDAEGNPDKLNMSIVAEGFIEVSGNPNLEPFYNESVDITDPNFQESAKFLALLGGRENVLLSKEILFYAGNDLKINGNTLQNFSGLMAAHMEFSVSGEPSLEGALVAENGRAQEAQGFGGPGQEVTIDRFVKEMITFNWIAGNPSIIGGSMDSPIKLAPWVDPYASVEAWRELIE